MKTKYYMKVYLDDIIWVFRTFLLDIPEMLKSKYGIEFVFNQIALGDIYGPLSTKLHTNYNLLNNPIINLNSPKDISFLGGGMAFIIYRRKDKETDDYFTFEGKNKSNIVCWRYKIFHSDSKVYKFSFEDLIRKRNISVKGTINGYNPNVYYFFEDVLFSVISLRNQVYKNKNIKSLNYE